MSEKSDNFIRSLESRVQEELEESKEGLEGSPGSKESITSDDEAETVTIRRKRSNKFSDSESDLEKENMIKEDNIMTPNKSESVNHDIDRSSSHIGTKKSRIKHVDTSESENSSSENVISQKKSIRAEDKMKKLKDKFKGLTSHHAKNSQEIETNSDEKLSKTDDENSFNSDEEVSRLKIKQKIKKSAYSINSICDPDTSDEESNHKPVHRPKPKQPKPRSTMSTSPKPMRMSAKQAMENMHKIKSESNRMLREKEVSLPYHRPKALSLKDIMSRRKPLVASDGKALPIKMNNDQLKEYVLLLEQRQKEVIELCKSDTEEEEAEEENCPDDEEITNVKNDISADNTNTNNIIIKNTNVTEPSLIETNIGQTVEENAGISNETRCIETDVEENIVNVNNNDIQQASIETESFIQTETVNEPAGTDVDKEYKENDLNNSSKSDKGQASNEKCTKNQLVKVFEQNSEKDSQNMELHYDSEKVESIQETEQIAEIISEVPTTSMEKQKDKTSLSDDDEFIDNDFNYDEIDKLIENARVANDHVQKDFTNPKLTGAPGMIIDLDNTDPLAPKQLTGVELFKERFKFFAKLKSLEHMEKDREKKFKPGLQHLKLRHQLEEQIAEQRSKEWEKRLEEENRLKSEIDGHLSDDDIDKLEAKLEETSEKVDDEKIDDESSEGEQEPIEDDIVLKDKPKIRNLMVDDEAEESECDEDIPGDNDERDVEISNGEADDGDEADLEDDDESSDSSSESEEECESKPRKGRILKAFEDSDDESAVGEDPVKNAEENTEVSENMVNEVANNKFSSSNKLKDSEASQDDELQLAQGNKSSEDLFSTQESAKPNLVVAALTKSSEDNTSADLGTQTFSILDSLGANQTLDLNSLEKTSVCRTQTLGDDLNLLIGVCRNSAHNLETTQGIPPQFSQTQEIGDDVVALCTGKFYDNPFLSPTKCKSPGNLLESSQTQEFGDDIAVLCTGKFYDNPFVSQYGDNSDINKMEFLKTAQKPKDLTNDDHNLVNPKDDKVQELNSKNAEKTILNSILEELDGPDFEVPRNKYFASDTQSDKTNVGYSQVKKKLVIDSDDETNDGATHNKNRKLRKRKAEERALQISDDDEEEEELADDQSDIEPEINEDEGRIIEYDSEENEVEVQQKTSNKKRIGEFFENEAELTSEDEWVGSGDEDERGLDRMEREEGDDETFHQGQLQRELGQIHMREVLDQDKREVRMIQELLFEDGDLGDGHRQRKFRWRNADGEEEIGTNPDEFLDTQEEEYESEEQWRKQRHEREMFLRKLQKKDEETLDTSINRTAIIKANLGSRSMSMLISENKGNKIESEDSLVKEKKPTKDIPSPKKSFTIFQQNYHGSLLTRGRGALARLAALATPLATDDDAPKVITSTNRRNFVFTALSQDEKQAKVTKRKADTNVNTPRLVKKMKTADANKHYRSTLFEHLKS